MVARKALLNRQSNIRLCGVIFGMEKIDSRKLPREALVLLCHKRCFLHDRPQHGQCYIPDDHMALPRNRCASVGGPQWLSMRQILRLLSKAWRARSTGNSGLTPIFQAF